ncbi:alginate O-acetyltransferase [Pseudomonas guariconensis]|uniref:alginate O-acetyltransferase n=1 Tax=Pseudomonas TaxID=286 RepID=UPI002096A5FE|nr:MULTISPECIES: alginate O-acetyltransferase [Pseudomonas]MCO7638720.1 alginate O-acetyltransferase [Pseudomonas sp. S 311-6]MCO7514945.1 alginate O-acetyltransferase [Pseudomonas putida]MCO7564441.1 alginate O-acetyltransferase [Pseudomonas mosselii]MCO7604172.1 alginate O-acetyltransferase [Pseudomonas guariconensis]MCO7615843.1 alginate O-acetyltransferase [Pseudomonas guariconensis]
MYPVMNSASKANGILFALVLAAMFVYSLPPVFSFARTQGDAWNLFVDGKLLRKFEQVYDKRFFLRDPSVQLWADAQFHLFGEGTKGVVLGKDGWLYTNQEYRVPNDLEANVATQLEQIAKVEKQLAEHGKHLVLLPLPMKLDIYAEHAEHAFDPRVTSLYDRFVGELQARQLDVVPLRGAFLGNLAGPGLFLKSDTHWSPQGARLSAYELARQRPQLRGDQLYRSHKAGEKNVKGDLMNYLQFDHARLAPQFGPSRIDLYETLKADQDADDLFAEQDQSLLLVGTSYSKIDDWNFVGFLKEALNRDLLSIAVEARGPFEAMNQFLASDQLANPQIDTVVWEFPLRTLLAHRPGSLSRSTQPQHF